jgi:hypothetical protein
MAKYTVSVDPHESLFFHPEIVVVNFCIERSITPSIDKNYLFTDRPVPYEQKMDLFNRYGLILTEAKEIELEKTA